MSPTGPSNFWDGVQCQYLNHNLIVDKPMPG
jgi:hypothetical protein